MNKKLTIPQKEIIRKALSKVRDMKSDDELRSFRDTVSVSDAVVEIKEVILENIDSRLNRKELTKLAIVEESEPCDINY